MSVQLKAMNQKVRTLFILHASPPAHGAARVGDSILKNFILNEKMDCIFIKINTSSSMNEIGKINLSKIITSIMLFFKILKALMIFKPEKIYFTSSIKGVAFYRDLILSLNWKFYKIFKSADIYYHYHTKGIDEFVSCSRLKLLLTRFFVNDVTLILLDKVLFEDLKKINSYKDVTYLSNGIYDELKEFDTAKHFSNKYRRIKVENFLYLSHMTKDKGYDFVLNLAYAHKNEPNLHFHFAGNWPGPQQKLHFENFIQDNKLNNITYHGFVDGPYKDALLKSSHILIYPSLNDAFPLTILESLSYGVPVLASNQGSIPSILNKDCGIIMNDEMEPLDYFREARVSLINEKVALQCRNHFLQSFTITNFKNKLSGILKP
jgi:glycosyltransferase involved in cell wall biosynthesis